jgi:hypothetical protein
LKNESAQAIADIEKCLQLSSDTKQRQAAQKLLDEFKPTTAPTATKEPENWVVQFAYNFPVGYWSAGEHQYTIITQPCLTATSNSFTQVFKVSTEGFLFTDAIVYFRLSGLRNSKDGSAITAPINPLQFTIAIFEWVQLKQSQVEVVKQCKIFISWDGGAQQPLTVKTPYQR